MLGLKRGVAGCLFGGSEPSAYGAEEAASVVDSRIMNGISLTRELS